MDQDKGISIIVRPKDPTSIQDFSLGLMPRLAPLERVTAQSTPEGLILSGVWEADIDDALELIKRESKVELRVSAPRIRYVDNPVPMEPCLRISIRVPEEYIGDVIADLNRRRCIVEQVKSTGTTEEISGHIPLRETLGYVATLDRLSHGTGAVSAQFWQYNPIPPSDDPKPRKAGAMRA